MTGAALAACLLCWTSHARGEARCMLDKVFSCSVIGLEGAVVQVEVDIARGLPSFTVVGSPYGP